MEASTKKEWKKKQQSSKHKYAILITDTSIQKLKKPIYFGNKCSNCFSTLFYSKEEKTDTKFFDTEIYNHGKEKLNNNTLGEVLSTALL